MMEYNLKIYKINCNQKIVNITVNFHFSDAKEIDFSINQSINHVFPHKKKVSYYKNNIYILFLFIKRKYKKVVIE